MMKHVWSSVALLTALTCLQGCSDKGDGEAQRTLDETVAELERLKAEIEQIKKQNPGSSENSEIESEKGNPIPFYRPSRKTTSSIPVVSETNEGESAVEAPREFTNTLGMKFVSVPGTNVMFCEHETRLQDYAAFAREGANVSDKWKASLERKSPWKWKMQELDHPVVNVTWYEAKAFCEWLSKKEGRTYRLPMDSEWSVAVGLHEDSQKSIFLKNNKSEGYPWEGSFPPPDHAGNYRSIETEKAIYPEREAHGYEDGYAFTAPVKSYQANRYGLYDLGGNVYEWCGDDRQTHAGSVIRGGSWEVYGGSRLKSSSRYYLVPDAGNDEVGFRVVVVMDAAMTHVATVAPKEEKSPVSPSQPLTKTDSSIPGVLKTNEGETLTKAPREFINTLGMKFVPVAGTDVMFCEHETRIKDYAAYAAENPSINMEWKEFRYGGFDHQQTEDHPVVNVTRNDSRAFCEWLSNKEGRSYRLPTDYEWSVAVGIGDREDRDAQPRDKKGLPDFPWGSEWPPPKNAGNFRGAEYGTSDKILGYTDLHRFTAPVKSYKVNRNGLYDLSGNACEWVEDLYSNTANHEIGVARGGSWWDSSIGLLHSSGRKVIHSETARHDIYGFRVVVEAETIQSPVKTKDPNALDPTSSTQDRILSNREMEGSKAGEVREFGGIEMVWCPPGQFMMGSPDREKPANQYEDEELDAFDIFSYHLDLNSSEETYGRLATSKETVFVNEIFDIKLFAFSKGSESIRDVLSVPLSPFENCANERWRTVRTEEVKLDGHTYSCAILPTLGFSPEPGKMEIGPTSISINRANERSGFNSFFSRGASEVTAPPATVQVLPLPPGAPTSFTGGVGSFDMVAGTVQDAVGVSKVFTFEIVVTGTGNHRVMRKPQPVEDQSEIWEEVDCFKWVDVGRTKEGKTNGKTTFFFTLRPKKKFEVIPPFELSYFDPSRESYQTLRTSPAPVRFITDLSESIVDEYPRVNLDQIGRHEREEQKRVGITRGFWIAKAETTQDQWSQISPNNSRFPGSERPVESISWEEANQWIDKMNQQFPVAENWKWALPSEAQWEYACRAGTQTPFSSENLDRIAWFLENSDWSTQKVATKKPNAWGIFDMHGNVREWCSDLAPKLNHRAYRGGSWRDYPELCRSAERRWNAPNLRFSHVGFRAVLVPKN